MSKIEWTEQTWNPIVGCSVVSPGCTNCYAMKMAARLEAMGTPRYAGLTKPSKAGAVWTGEMRLVEDALTLPLRRRKPTTYFVNSMSDLFHESVPDAWIDRVFAVMAASSRQTFQLLTKRSARMRAYLTAEDVVPRIITALRVLNESLGSGASPRDWRGGAGWDAYAAAENLTLGNDRSSWPLWPLNNLWLGVSTEDQRRADERVPDLLATPAAVRFVSAEPLLGPINFSRIDDGAAHREVPREEWGPLDDDESPPSLWWDALTGERTIMHGGLDGSWARTDAALDWIIVGSESGLGARACDIDWVRSIRDQCMAADVPFFWKQHVKNGRKITLPQLDGRTWADLPRSTSAF